MQKSWKVRPVILSHSFMVNHPHHKNISEFSAWILIIACKRKKKNKKHSTVINDFYLLVSDYLESWLNFMIVSMFILEIRQVGDVRNCEPQTQWLSLNSRLDTSLNFLVYWVEIFQNAIQNLLSQNYVNLLHLYHTQTSSLAYNLAPAISWVLIDQHLIFCSPTWPTGCNSLRKCTSVKYKARQRAGFPIVT